MYCRYYLNDLTYREDPPREEKRRKRKTRRRRRRKNRRNRAGMTRGARRPVSKETADIVTNEREDADGGSPFAEPTG